VFYISDIGSIPY